MRNITVIAVLVALTLSAPAAEARDPQNRPGLFAREPAYVVGESGGCPTLLTPGGFPQFDDGAADKAAVVAEARAACLEAAARATATVARAEAGAYAVKMAADRGDPVFASDKVVAVGMGPATLAAGVGMGVVNPLALGTLGYQGAAMWAATPLPPPVITPPAAPAPPRPRAPVPTAAEVAAAEGRARAAAEAAQADGR